MSEFHRLSIPYHETKTEKQMITTINAHNLFSFLLLLCLYIYLSPSISLFLVRYFCCFFLDWIQTYQTALFLITTVNKLSSFFIVHHWFLLEKNNITIFIYKYNFRHLNNISPILILVYIYTNVIAKVGVAIPEGISSFLCVRSSSMMDIE